MSERISLFLDKLEENPDSLLNRFSLAQAYFESGNYEQAIIEKNKSLQNIARALEAQVMKDQITPGLAASKVVAAINAN